MFLGHQNNRSKRWRKDLWERCQEEGLRLWKLRLYESRTSWSRSSKRGSTKIQL